MGAASPSFLLHGWGEVTQQFSLVDALEGWVYERESKKAE
jgi:hypothetical protein